MADEAGRRGDALRTAFRRLVSQFNNLFMYFLIAAAVVTAVLGEWLDSGVIVGVVLVIVNMASCRKAEPRVPSRRRGLLAPKARILRDGQEHDIPAEDLVPGDIAPTASWR